MNYADIERRRISAAIAELPDEALAEVARFVEYLRHNSQRNPVSCYHAVHLGGIWEGMEMTDQHIELLR